MTDRPSPKGDRQSSPAAHPASAPRWLKQLVHWQDEAIRIPGTDQRIGFDAIVGFLLPGVGDLASAAVSMVVVISAIRRGVPVRMLFVMVLNILVDTALGSLPIVGDIFDVAFRASSKNLELLERHGQAEAVRGAAGRSARLLLLLGAIALTLLFVGVMLSVLMGFVWGWLTW